MKQKFTIIFALVIGSIILLSLSLNQVYGQEQVNNSTVGKSMVDKLIEDTRKNQVIGESYRAELINRIENTTCLSVYSESAYTTRPGHLFEVTDLIDMETEQLEKILKLCVAGGIIK